MPACPDCGYIHASTDARAVGRFASTRGYVAVNAGTPIRPTRAQAESDECSWRQERRQEPTTAASPPPRARSTEEEPTLFTAAELAPTPEPVEFPSATMETAARAKAWCDFLTEVRMSLLVWDVDAAVRAECEHVVDWIRRCRDELLVFTSSPEPY